MSFAVLTVCLPLVLALAVPVLVTALYGTTPNRSATARTQVVREASPDLSRSSVVMKLTAV